MRRLYLLAILTCIGILPIAAQEDEPQSKDAAAAEMARKLQDPLAYIKALMTDNDFLFKTGQNDDFSFSSSIQPLKAWSFDEAGFNFIARGVIPVLGLAPEAKRPPIVTDPAPNSTSTTWGLGDIVGQFFFSPKSKGAWKWGIGPQISLRTRTTSELAGAGWGAGPTAVIVGAAGPWSPAIIIGNLWGFDGQYNTFLFQPMIFYNIASVPGMAIAYNNQINYNWKASSGNGWTVPLGISVSKTFAFDSGLGLDVGLGPYWNVVRPQGTANNMLRISLALVFP